MKSTFIKNENVKAKIRSILTPDKATLFVNNAHYIMAIINGGAVANVAKTLNDNLGGPGGVASFTAIYKELQSIEYNFKGKKKGGVITGSKTLLNHLTDGSSHFDIYPDVKFQTQ